MVGSDLIGDGDDDSDEEDDDGMLALTKENVDRVLDEVCGVVWARVGRVSPWVFVGLNLSRLRTTTGCTDEVTRYTTPRLETAVWCIRIAPPPLEH